MDVIFEGPLGDICTRCEKRELRIEDVAWYAYAEVYCHSTTVYCENEDICKSILDKLKAETESPHPKP